MPPTARTADVKEETDHRVYIPFLTPAPTADSAPTPEYLVCPVCSFSRAEWGCDVEKLSRHIDECLNKQAIKELLASERFVGPWWGCVGW